jgi:hypothetical protein
MGGAVTEAEWLACTDPQKMLEFLRGKASDRKLRLFACACVRRVWHRLGEVAAPTEIEASERFADGQSSRNELRSIRSQLGARGGYSAAWAANNALHAVLENGADIAASRAAIYSADFLYYFTDEQKSLTDTGSREEAVAAREVERTELTCVLRDIFDNPFRPVAINPAWVAWNDGTVQKIAQAIYDERAFDRMPILADALEEAGCTNQDMLAHCRSGGEHVRGCWAVDLILGRL